ncbi:MAG: 3Fe-4S ferredoxin [Actinomycetia bacterium]|nr:3Fe-4S ferredoxin [Actinomycetes bacterium]
MRIVVDRELCTGQAVCQSMAADIFEIGDDGEVEIKAAIVPDGRLAEAERAVACCPNAALRLVSRES